MIDCSTAVRQLWDFIEQDLTLEDQTLVEEHLAFCRRCCGEVEFAEELRAFLMNAAKPRLPEDAETRLSEFISTIEEAP